MMRQEVLYRYCAKRLREGTMPHAVLLSAQENTLRDETALAVGRAILCDARLWFDACTCASCAKVGRGVHPDLRVLGQEESDRYIKLEPVREAVSWLWRAPFSAAAKVLVVKGAQRLTGEAASAFLKVMEEPLPARYLLLTARQPRDLFSTLVSRCMCLFVSGAQRCGQQPLSPLLEKFFRDPLSLLADLAQGTREAASEGLALIACGVRDLALWNVARRPELLLSGAAASDLDLACRRFESKRLLDFLEALDQAQAALKGNLNPKLVLTCLEVEWQRA